MHYRYDAPHTDLGDSVLEHIDRGDLTDASFAFTIADEPDAQRWEKRDGKIYRTIFKIDRLYDISNVWTGAYAAASTHRNSPDEYEKYINEINAQEELESRQKEQERVDNINQKLDDKLKEFYKNISI